jgi:flavin-dependent dehydrogenase
MQTPTTESPRPAPTECDVVVIGGGLVGSMAAIMLRKRGLTTVVLESRAEGQEQKAVVGEAFTEGTSVFVRHEIGLGDWLFENAYRKFGFDFVTQPRNKPAPRDLDGCHELLLSLTPIEKIPAAFSKLIPTFHVNRPPLNAEVARRAAVAGANFRHGAAVRHVELGDLDHRVDYDEDGEARSVRCKWVLDVSGRRRVLGRQLDITKPMDGLETASIWNRFTNVRTDKAFWQTFHGIDRRRHTIHWTGPGFWFWWIHIDAETTSVGVSFDKAQHQPNIKNDDRGFWEMVDKFPVLRDALAGAKPVEDFSYYANLAYESEHWVSKTGYALIGDASTFVDALYSVGIEMACRQLMAVIPLVEDTFARPAKRPCSKTVAKLNQEHQYLQESVRRLNRFKYTHAWHQPHILVQTALYDLAEIAELYHLQDPKHWTRENVDRHYRLQWGTKARRDALIRFMETAEADGARDSDDQLFAKALIPGRIIYTATLPLWHLPKARPYFFIITRGWGYMERMTQRFKLWPDFLSLMAGKRRRDPMQTIGQRQATDP